MLTGAVPLTLDAFTKLDINLVGDNIDELDDTFCDNDEWMAGADQRYGCKANLCPKNKYHPRGRQIDDSRDCEDCDPGEDAPFMGSLTCRSQGLLFEERIILMQIYDALNGTGILMLLCALGMVWGVMVMMKTVASHRCNWATTILRLLHPPRKHP
mmetsp:Transcript_16190/g.23757  ORF Transcript_16190/g.23757 Transcript_16190/m.23757 type:complete len:156 (-) Transcript_16190:36-503(-)